MAAISHSRGHKIRYNTKISKWEYSDTDKDRINSFLKQLEALWLQYPDLRFSQIIAVLENELGGHTFYIDDEKWLNAIYKFIEENNGLEDI